MLRKKKTSIDFEDNDLSGYSSNQLKKIADYTLRKHLLSKWDGRCFISRKRLKTKNAEVAHYIPRQYIKYRYSFVNCHLTSKYSNSYENSIYNKEIYGKLSKHEWEYRKRLVSVYGEEVVKEMENTCRKAVVYNKDYYKEIIQNLRDGKY